MTLLHLSINMLLDNIFCYTIPVYSLWKYNRHVYWKCSNVCGDAATCLHKKNDPLCSIDMDGLVEIKGIKAFVLLAQFIEKQVFIVSCSILNFSRYFSLD